jgi:galactose-1-phosphate uridylyltransferase
MSKQALERHVFEKILQVEDVKTLTYPDLVKLFREEKGISDYLPDGVYQIDPRNKERILYNSTRGKRPHDNRPSQLNNKETGEVRTPCIVCQGKTTGAIDVADLSSGYTFINKNLFPILYPSRDSELLTMSAGDDEAAKMVGKPADGLHLLQWTSSVHDQDWHNMPASDRFVVMSRLAALEGTLIKTSKGFMPETADMGDLPGRYGYVSIIKNQGYLVGGSLVHGHQQIVYSNVMPRRTIENRNFELEKGEPFSAFILRNNPKELLIEDYGAAVLLVPYFMRRPFDMMLLLKDTHKRYLFELTDDEILAVANGWHDAIRLILQVMPKLDREIAYNVITHNGPGAGLYFEFLPYTQEVGGLEHLGLAICQANPQAASTFLRDIFETIEND